MTKQGGGNWECTPAIIFADATVDGAHGDVFGLANRPYVPFVLSRERTTIAELERSLSAREPNRATPKLDQGCDQTVSRLQEPRVNAAMPASP